MSNKIEVERDLLELVERNLFYAKLAKPVQEKLRALLDNHIDEADGMVADGTLTDERTMAATRRTDEVQFKGMIETRDGKFAIMIDEANVHYGWTFQRHPDGMWVSGRKATDTEMHAARAHAKITEQL